MLLTPERCVELDCWPCEVLDGNGMVIRRAVTSADTETGEVLSYCKYSDGRYITDESGNNVQRVERYPLPLTWHKITPEQARTAMTRYWDLEGK